MKTATSTNSTLNRVSWRSADGAAFFTGVSANGIKAIRQVDGQWEVELVKALAADFPAGTKVRQHRGQGNCYWFGVGISNTWKQIKAEVSGVSATREPGKFWPGTKFVKVAIYNATSADDPVLVDDVVFSRLE